jgi:hypothetical protein
MMDWTRKNFQPVFFASKGEQVAVARVDGGMQRTVSLVTAGDLSAVVRRVPGNNAEREIRAQTALTAPVRQDQSGGKLVALVAGRPVAEVDLVPAQPVDRVWTATMAGVALPWTGPSMLLALLLLGPRYVRAFAKGARRRRRRFAAGCGEPDLQREGLC